MDEIELAQYIVVCHTDKCENAEIVISIQADAQNPNVVCGPCNNFITDVTLAK